MSLRDQYPKKLTDLSQNSQNIRYGEISNCLFDTYKHLVIPHGRYIFATVSDMDMATMCAYPLS